MKIEDIPAWVPEPVRRAASVFGAGHPLIANLLSTPRMEAVWRYFEGHAIETDFKDRFGRGTGLVIPDLHGVDLHWPNTPNSSQALVFLFYAILVAANNTRVTAYAAVIDAELTKLRDTISHVEALRSFAPNPTPLPMEVESAIATIIEHCQSNIDLLDYKDKPSVLKRRGDNDIARACIRSIGAATYALYGECSYKSLAVVANAMFSPEIPVTEKNVAKWCTDQPLPLKADLNRTTH